MSPAWVRLVPKLLVALAAALPLLFATRKSVTVDEVAHIPAGYSYLRTGEIVLNPMHPPLVKEISALALLSMNLPMPADAATIRRLGSDVTYQWEFGERFLSGPRLEEIVLRARVPAILLSAALAALVFVWSRELWGLAGAILALVLYVFDPTIAAHSQLVTTDVGFAFFAALFVFLLRRWVGAPSAGRLAAVGVALGLALGTKFSAVALIPVAALLVTQATWQSSEARLLKGIGSFVGMLALAAVILWAIYLFSADPFFYVRGLQSVQSDYNPEYLHFLMGELRTEPWPTYFLVGWLVKTPIPAIVVVVLAIAFFAGGRRVNVRDEAFVILPFLILFVGYSLLADPIGYRYVIPCLPFLYVFAGRVGREWAALGKRGAAIAALLGVWYVGEYIRIAPDHLSYFNQIAGGPRGGLAWLDDSNVDWGQGLIQLREYLEQNPAPDAHLCTLPGVDPALYGIHAKRVWIDDLISPASGRLILSSHCVARASASLRQMYDDGPRNWMAHTEPSAVVGHAYYVYDRG